MISRLFRGSFAPSKLMARSAGGWQRPDPPIMVKYQNRRTLGLINKFLHKNDGVAPVYIINDYSNEQTLFDRFANIAKGLWKTAIFLTPFVLAAWFMGSQTPEFFDVGLIDIKKTHNKWVLQDKYDEVKKNNPYGVDVDFPNPKYLIYNPQQQKCNLQHRIVRAQGFQYIWKLHEEVVNDIKKGQSQKPAEHHH